MTNLIILLVVIVVQAIVERCMGRLWISDKGIRIFGTNSQMMADWYSLSHVIHGYIFYGLFHSWWWAFAAAVAVEAGWEILENSPIIINKYRQTASVDYYGDTILNSVCDVLFMSFGFLYASYMPWYGTLATALVMEFIPLMAIRDNLTLNVVMLIYPFQCIRKWQIAGGADKALRS